MIPYRMITQQSAEEGGGWTCVRTLKQSVQSLPPVNLLVPKHCYLQNFPWRLSYIARDEDQANFVFMISMLYFKIVIDTNITQADKSA